MKKMTPDAEVGGLIKAEILLYNKNHKNATIRSRLVAVSFINRPPGGTNQPTDQTVTSYWIKYSIRLLMNYSKRHEFGISVWCNKNELYQIIIEIISK